jgi:hypothetical protein
MMMLISALLTSTTTFARAGMDDANVDSQTAPNSRTIQYRKLRRPPHGIHWRAISAPLLAMRLWYLRCGVGIPFGRVVRLNGCTLTAK